MALTAFEKLLILITTTLVLSDVGLLTIIVVLWRIRKFLPSPTSCSSVACVSAASNLHYHVNLTADPCDDFYEYACGRFLNHAVIPDDSTSISTLTSLTEEVDENIRASLLTPYKPDAPKYEIFLKKYFRSCMDLSVIEMDDLRPIKELLKHYGGWPMTLTLWNETSFDLGSTLGDLIRIGSAGLLRFSVGVDRSNPSVKVSYIEQDSVTFPKEYYLRNGSKMVKALREYIKKVSNLFTRNPIKSYQLEEDVSNIINLERDLSQIVIPSQERIPYIQTNNTKNYLRANFEKSLDFGRFFVKLFYPRDAKDVSPLGISDVSYFDKLAPIIKKTPKRTLSNYLLLKLITSFSAAMPHDFRDIETRFLSVTKGINEAPARWITCVYQLKMRMYMPLGALYVKHHFNQITKNKVLQLTEDLIESVRTLITEANWLHDKTKSYALEKLSSLRSVIGYPDYYDLEDPFQEMFKNVKVEFKNFLNLNILVEEVLLQYKIFSLKQPVDHQKLPMDITAVDAVYAPFMNLMIFPVGMLRFPFFSIGVQMCLNFGGLGHVMGHEIIHGFDNLGNRYDKDGNSKYWWEKEDENNFGVASRCFINQYNNFVVPGVGVKVDGKVTLDENIADNGGVKASFMAYKKWVKKHGKELKLPGLDLTPEQLFFLNVGRVHCTKQRPQQQQEAKHLKLRSHTPSRFRVNGMLKNMEEFAEVYKCPLGSPMNPIKKCRLW